MHRSRLGAVIIDCNDIEAGVSFWTQALGVPVRDRSHPYTSLQSPIPGLEFALQEVPEGKTAKSRIHLDIEADDIEAEVRRLEGLGARRVKQIESWYVLTDPCGNEFCVIEPLSRVFEEQARMWET